MTRKVFRLCWQHFWDTRCHFSRESSGGAAWSAVAAGMGVVASGVSASRSRRPGNRAIVQFAVYPGYSHERLWLYPVIDNDCVVLTPGVHANGEAVFNYSYLHLFEPKHYDYPSVRPLSTVMQFEYSVDTGGLRAYIGVAVLEAEMERTLQPFKAAPLSPITFTRRFLLPTCRRRPIRMRKKAGPCVWTCCVQVETLGSG